MKTKFITIKEIKTPIKITQRLYLYDIAFISIYTLVATRFEGFVHPWLRYPYYGLCILWGIYLTTKSGINKEKRNWQSILYYIARNHCYYKDHVKTVKKVKG